MVNEKTPGKQRTHPIPPYDLYLIDADGTLLDFEAGEAAALDTTFRQFGLPVDTMDSYRRINAGLWRRLAEGTISRERLFSSRFGLFARAHGIALDSLQVNRFFLEQLSHQAQHMPGAEAMLQALSSRAKVAVVTNGVSFAQKERFRRAGFLPYIRHLVVSEDVGAEKPAALIFERALALCGHADKTTVLMVGDELATDIAGANAFGIASCLYDPAGKHPQHQAAYRISSLQELV